MSSPTGSAPPVLLSPPLLALTCAWRRLHLPWLFIEKARGLKGKGVRVNADAIKLKVGFEDDEETGVRARAIQPYVEVMQHCAPKIV